MSYNTTIEEDFAAIKAHDDAIAKDIDLDFKEGDFVQVKLVKLKK